MKKGTCGRGGKLNNEGFSLVELLIAVTILAIIVVPMMKIFVSSARLNAKSSNSMHATSIAEDVMEEFEAYDLETLKTRYENEWTALAADPANPGGGTAPIVARDETTGVWTFQGTDAHTTGGSYDVRVVVDPRDYGAINGEALVNLQNLSGSVNAIFVEKGDAAMNAYLAIRNSAGDHELAKIAKNTSKHITVKISQQTITVDLGEGVSQSVPVYLVTASQYFECKPIEMTNGSVIKYPQNSDDYIVFSNESAVLAQAEAIREKKAAGIELTEDDVIQSRLANVVLCITPSYGGEVDIVTVENIMNVDANIYLVKQNLAPEIQDFIRGKASPVLEERGLFAGDESKWLTSQTNYRLDYTLKEDAGGWMSSSGTDGMRSHATLRTNMLDSSNNTYTFHNARFELSAGSVGGSCIRNANNVLVDCGTGGGEQALTIMSVDDLTPAEVKDRMYDITVSVYRGGTGGGGDPLITMTGTVTQ